MNHTITGFVAVDGARLAYETAGQGPPLVLVHAGIADSGMWDPQVETFAQRFRVIRYDVRTFGRSTPVSEEPYADHDDLRAVLSHLGVERAAVIGASNGGRIALDFALAYPAMVEALILAAPGLRGFAWSEAVREGWAEEEAAIGRGDLDAAVAVNLRMWVDGPRRTPARVQPAVRERARAMVARCLSQSAGDGAVRPLDPPAAGRLSEIRAPTLIIVGAEDQDDMHAIAGLLANGIAGARKLVIPGGAHLVSMEQPREFNRIVREFLSGRMKDAS